MYDNLYQIITCKAEVMPLKVAEATLCSLSQAMIQLSIAISITADHVTETWDLMGDNTHIQIILKAMLHSSLDYLNYVLACDFF